MARVLSIGKVALGGEDYYLATTASGREHFEGLVEADGRWLGSGAASLGLAGVAEGRDIRRLLRAREPGSGTPMLQGADRRSVAAFDCTFSVPKSVSVVQAFSPDETVRVEIRLGHEAAVEATLAYLAEAAVAGRADGVDGRLRVPGDLVAVGFLHRLSRSADPHLHSHVLVANLVTDPEGGPARPLEASGLFLECRTAGALYETHLRHELTRRLGVEWQPLEGRCWSDLKGLDRGVIREFSQRSNAIIATLQAEGWHGPAARRAASELTRPPKDFGRSYEQALEAAWDRLFSAGVTTTRLREVCHRRPLGGDAGPRRSGDARSEEALRLLSAGTVDGRFGKGEVIRACCATERDGRSVGDVLADAREILEDGRLLARGRRTSRLRGPGGSFPAGRPEAQWTTAELADTEARLVRTARSMDEARPGSVSLLAYRSGGRCEALDALSADVARWRAEGRLVVAVAPGRMAAAAVESSIGADAVVLAGRGSTPGSVPVVPRSVLVVADAQAFGPAALDAIVRAVAGGGADTVLLCPEHAVANRSVLSELSALGLRREARDGSPPWLQPPGGPRQVETDGDRHRFAAVEVTVVGSLGAACDEAARRLRAAAAEGRPALVVSADESVAAAVRQRAGAGEDAVLHSRRLRAPAAAASGPVPELVVIGGASVLRAGRTASPTVVRSHILVAPAVVPRSADGLGRAAEAARPRYLVGELGRPGGGLAEREAWRAAAVAVEGYRQRWGVQDHTRAFGAEHPRRLEPPRLADRVAAERKASVARLAGRSLDRVWEGRALERPALEGQGLGAGAR